MTDSSSNKPETQPSTTPLPTTGDSIVVGDLTRTVAAIGRGASLIYQQALSAAEQAREQERFERQKLAEAVARLAQELAAQATTAPRDTGNPYKGLLHYELADTAHFFGRDVLIEELLAQVTGGDFSTPSDDARCRFVVLHGETGVGKTSLLEAGITPALIAAQHLPLLVRVTPSSLVTRIKQTVLPELHTTPNLEGASLQAFMRQVADLLPHGKRVFILLDQFEAFFALPAPERQSFVDELARCLFDNDPRDHWIVGIRSSWLGHLSTFQPTIPQPFVSTPIVSPLSRAQARTAILEPATASGFVVQEALINTLLDDLGGDAIGPSRLQLVCQALIDELAPGEDRLTLATYEQTGGASAILSLHLDRVLARNLAPADREPAWRLMVAVADHLAGTATTQALVKHMQTYEVHESDTQRLLGLLESNRLLRQGDQTFELTSASLLPRIRDWAGERAVLEQARAETVRQIARVRDSALRGMIGGAIGFALAFLLTYYRQTENKALLSYITAYRALPGALAGLLLTLSIDVTLASTLGPRRQMRWVLGGVSGAVAFALVLVFHALFRLKGDAGSLLRVAAEGSLWGFVTGICTIWIMTTTRPPWQTLPPSVFACALVLGIAETFGNAFQNANLGEVFGAGIVMPLFVITAALLPRWWKEIKE